MFTKCKILLAEHAQHFIHEITHQWRIDSTKICDVTPSFIIPIVQEELPLESNYCLASLNDEYIATGHDNHQGIKIWNLNTKICERIIKGFKSVDAMECLNSHSLICYSVSTNCMYICHWRNGSIENMIDCGSFRVCTFSRKNLLPFDEGRYLLTSCENSKVALWNLTCWTILRTFEGHSNRVTCIEYGTDGCFFSGSLDATIRIWNLESGICEHVLKGHKRYVLSLAIIDQYNLASSGGDLHIRLWNLRNMSCTAVLRGHQDIIRRISVLGSDLLCSASDDNCIKIWDTFSLKFVTTLKGGHKGSVFEAISACRGSKLVSMSFDRTMRIWNLLSESAEMAQYFKRLLSHIKQKSSVWLTDISIIVMTKQ